MAGPSNGRKSKVNPQYCNYRSEDEGDALPTEKPDLTEPIPILGFNEANDWLNGGHAFLIDVREAIQVLNHGKIKTSTRISAYDIMASFTLDEKDFYWKHCVPKPLFHHPILIYCQSGMKAPSVAQKLRKLGYFQVGIMAGGFKQWVANGGDVVLCPERNFHFSGFY
jgi:rhodanese-related sulfurtransferase